MKLHVERHVEIFPYPSGSFADVHKYKVLQHSWTQIDHTNIQSQDNQQDNQQNNTTSYPEANIRHVVGAFHSN